MDKMTLDEKLAKIKSPNLESQRETAIILSAIEDTLRSQKSEFTPTAYFAALLALLGQALSSDSSTITNPSLASPTVYLLDIVTSHVPASLLRSKFSTIVTSLAPALTASPDGSSPTVEAPLLRAAIGTLESVLLAQDTADWALSQTTVSPRAAIAGLLVLAKDPRPKVRKRALDALAGVLRNRPPGPSMDHPAADVCAETALGSLKEATQSSVEGSGSSKKRGRQNNGPAGEDEAGRRSATIRALQLVRVVADACGGWPSKRIEALSTALLDVARGAGDEHLARAALDVFEALFAGIAADPEGTGAQRLPRLLEAVNQLRPNKEDAQLLPPWIAVLARAQEIAAVVEPEDTFARLPELFEMISDYLASHSHDVRISASECLIAFCATCVPDAVILEPSVYDEKTMEKLGKVVRNLLSVKYQQAWVEVFGVIAALFDALKWRASPLLDETIKTVGELRSNDSFNGKKEADTLLGKAVEAIGPGRVLEILPLNLVKQKQGQPGRAWLLPILRDHVINTELQHFRTDFVPLSEIMFQKVLSHEGKEKTMEVKIYETLVQQIWALLPGYCTLALDIVRAFDQSFAEMISNVLYQQTNLRSDLCKALQLLVDSNKQILAIETEGEEDLIAQRHITKAQARDNINHLAAFAGNLLAVLFNVYSQTLPQYRGFILQCINAYLSITPEQELMETFAKVVAMLEEALLESTPQTQAEKQKQNQPSQNKMPPTSHTLMDLVITLSIHLPRSSYSTLFTITSKILPHTSDPQLQKKAYKLIPRLGSCETGVSALRERSTELQQLLLETAPSASAPARRDRLNAIAVVIEHIPASTDLHFIPAILSEVIVATKEVNEKARTAAFDTLILMGEKMSAPGNIIVQSKVPGMAVDAQDAEASLDEFLTMVSAGLAGATPNVISASIVALTRVMFEFRDRLDPKAVEELVSTMDLFLQSKNREVVRAVLGFVKLAAVALPDGMVRPRLSSLVPGLVSWSHEHKQRFKSKVKHILERLMRRFGNEVVEENTPEADRKLIQNIRKTKQRSKRKREEAKAAGNENETTGAETRRGRFESEFDEAVYGSESSSDEGADDDDDPDGDADMADTGNGRRKGRASYIIEDEDEPLDLLDRKALASISSTKPIRFKRVPEGTRRKAKTDLDGKLILGDDGGDVEEDDMVIDGGADGSGAGVNAYVDAIKGRDAAKRGRGGKFKFSNRKGQADNDDEEMDVDGADVARAIQGNRRRSGSGGRGGFGPRSPRGGRFSRGRGSGGRVAKAGRLGSGSFGPGKQPRKRL